MACNSMWKYINLTMRSQVNCSLRSQFTCERGVSISEESMNIFKCVILSMLLLSLSSLAEDGNSYFALGDWKLGEKYKQLKGDDSPFKNIDVVKEKKHYTATAKTIFSEDTPVGLFFKRGKLHRIELYLYSGNEYEMALASSRSIITKFEAEYGGAFLEGYTTSEGLKPETFDQVVGQLLEKSKSAMSDINNESDDGGDAYFNMFISLSTEYKPKNNFLYGKFSYFGDKDTYTVTVYEDKKFNDDHVAPTMIHIGSLKNANK